MNMPLIVCLGSRTKLIDIAQLDLMYVYLTYPEIPLISPPKLTGFYYYFIVDKSLEGHFGFEVNYLSHRFSTRSILIEWQLFVLLAFVLQQIQENCKRKIFGVVRFN